MSQSSLPLLNHPLQQPSAFTPEALIDAVRNERGLPASTVPDICVLEFDGDLTDWLISNRGAVPCSHWACFHTTMYTLEVDGCSCAIIPRTIGGPYSVLVAEQLAASGARIIMGLTSAWRSRRLDTSWNASSASRQSRSDRTARSRVRRRR